MTEPPAAPPAGGPSPGARPPTAAVAALAALRERFVASAGRTVALLHGFAVELATSPAAPEVIEALRRELHRVHGTAGTYGFAEASRLAAELEEQVARWVDDPRLDADRRAAIVERFAAALAASLGADQVARTPARGAS